MKNKNAMSDDFLNELYKDMQKIGRGENFKQEINQDFKEKGLDPVKWYDEVDVEKDEDKIDDVEKDEENNINVEKKIYIKINVEKDFENVVTAKDLKDFLKEMKNFKLWDWL